MQYTLGKEEKLKSKKLIDQLFAEGKHVKSFPLRLIYSPLNHDGEFPIKVGFSVPKRNVKLAVDRNRIKRLMREVYRKNKHLFLDNIENKYVNMFIYMAKEEIKYTDLELCLKKVSTKLITKIKEDEPSVLNSVLLNEMNNSEKHLTIKNNKKDI
jgi:ribonuclease P protein component